MCQIQVSRKYDDQFKVINHLGTEYLVEIAKDQQQIPKLEELQGRELVRLPVKDGYKARMYRVENIFYLIAKGIIVEIVGAKQACILLEEANSWSSLTGYVTREVFYCLAIQGEDNVIYFYQVLISQESIQNIRLIEKVSQDYLPSEDSYNAEIMPFGIKVNRYTMDTFWALLENKQGSKSGAFELNINRERNRINFVKVSKDELLGEMFNPRYILTKTGIVDRDNYKTFEFGVENAELMQELPSYMNIPCEGDLCLALPKDIEYISKRYDMNWYAKSGIIDAFVWNRKTMEKVYPIQMINSTTKLVVYDSKLPHIVVTEESDDTKQYHVYYWQDEKLMVITSNRMPFIFAKGYNRVIIVRDTAGNDHILQLTPQRNLVSEVQGYVVECGYFVNKDTEKEPTYVDCFEGYYHFANSPLQIFALKSTSGKASQVLLCYQGANAFDDKPLVMHPYHFDASKSMQPIKHGYIKLFNEQDGTEEFYDWERKKFYYEKDLWNASVEKAQKFTSIG